MFFGPYNIIFPDLKRNWYPILVVKDSLTQEVYEMQEQQPTFMKALDKRNS